MSKKHEMHSHEEEHEQHDGEQQANQDRAGEEPGKDSPGDRIAALEREVAEARDQKLRAIAELDNVRRRAQQQAADTVRYANEKLLKELLPIIDDFERSLESSKQTHAEDKFYQGVEMIERKLRKALESIGVERIKTVGEQFDFELHEAILRQPSDKPEDEILTEVEPGYRYGDRIIRHAKVIVSAGSENG